MRVEVYEPYVELGGNGLAKKMMDELEELPIQHEYTEPDKEEET
jgi:hypothetical protein